MSNKGYRSSCSAGRATRESPRVLKPVDKQGVPDRISLMSPNGCASTSSHRKAGTRGGRMSTHGGVVGIDVSKGYLDVAIGSESLRFGNAAEGIAELGVRLRAQAVDLVVMEATGGYEMQVATALAGAGIRLAVVNP